MRTRLPLILCAALFAAACGQQPAVNAAEEELVTSNEEAVACGGGYDVENATEATEVAATNTQEHC